MTPRRFLAIFLVAGVLVGLVGHSPVSGALLVAFGVLAVLIDWLVDAIHPEPAVTHIRGERWIVWLLAAAVWISLVVLNGLRFADLGFVALGLLAGMLFSHQHKRRRSADAEQ